MEIYVSNDVEKCKQQQFSVTTSGGLLFCILLVKRDTKKDYSIHKMDLRQSF